MYARLIHALHSTNPDPQYAYLDAGERVVSTRLNLRRDDAYKAELVDLPPKAHSVAAE